MERWRLHRTLSVRWRRCHYDRFRVTAFTYVRLPGTTSEWEQPNGKQPAQPGAPHGRTPADCEASNQHPQRGARAAPGAGHAGRAGGCRGRAANERGEQSATVTALVVLLAAAVLLYVLLTWFSRRQRATVGLERETLH